MKRIQRSKTHTIDEENLGIEKIGVMGDQSLVKPQELRGRKKTPGTDSATLETSIF